MRTEVGRYLALDVKWRVRNMKLVNRSAKGNERKSLQCKWNFIFKLKEKTLWSPRIIIYDMITGGYQTADDGTYQDDLCKKAATEPSFLTRHAHVA